jgi:hypothetical protein
MASEVLSKEALDDTDFAIGHSRVSQPRLEQAIATFRALRASHEQRQAQEAVMVELREAALAFFPVWDRLGMTADEFALENPRQARFMRAVLKLKGVEGGK